MDHINTELLDLIGFWDVKFDGLAKAHRTIVGFGDKDMLEAYEEIIDQHLENQGVQLNERYGDGWTQKELDDLIESDLNSLPIKKGEFATQIPGANMLTAFLITYIWHLHRLVGYKSIWRELDDLITNRIEANREAADA